MVIRLDRVMDADIQPRIRHGRTHAGKALAQRASTQHPAWGANRIGYGVQGDALKHQPTQGVCAQVRVGCQQFSQRGVCIGIGG